jgi:galactonate dehydratase
MKITKIESIHAGQFLFVRIHTDAGIHGVGEGGVWGHVEAAKVAVDKFATYLVGKDPFPIEHHWNIMHRFSYFQGHAINAAISAIDIALWDIKGKALGVPVYELLGGAVRTSARVYGHVYEKTIEGVLESLKRQKERGFTAVGHINPFLDEGEDQVYFEPHIEKMRKAIDNVRRMREVAGDDMDLCIEIHRRLTPAEAIVLARGIEPYHPMFIEDPMRFEDADAMARIADRIRVPIATGERFSTIYEFQALFTRKAVEYARVDVCLCGGITGAKKVAAMAEAHNVMVVPHNPLSPVGLLACLQVAASIPNFAIQEYSTGFEANTFTTTAKHLGHDIVDEAPEAVDGFVAIPDRVGLGIDLVDDPTSVRPPLSKPVIMRLHRDGSPVDQ